jgi:hypothetical protein
VWMFYQESPWQGERWRYFGPVAVPGRSLEYTLYYRNNLNNFDDYVWESMIAPATIVPESEDPFSGTDSSAGTFFQIIENLTVSHDQANGTALPQSISALEFMLHKGLLTIRLSGTPPAGQQAIRVMIRSLVYTFTELPEVDRVLATLNGEFLSDGQLIWDDPLGRMDLE